MFSNRASKSSTRGQAAAAPSAAGPSTNQTPPPSTPSAPSPMRTRSGRILAPIAEGVKAVRSKLTGGRRAPKATANAPTGAEASTSAQAEATSSTVAKATSAPAPRKTTKRAAAARGRAAKGKASKGKAVARASPVPSPPPERAPSPAPAPVPAPAAAAPPSASEADARPRPVVPEHRRLKREGAYFFDKHGRAMPQGVYPDEKGRIPTAALLEEIEREVPREVMLKGRKFKPHGSIHGLVEFGPRFSFVYEPFTFNAPLERLPPRVWLPEALQKVLRSSAPAHADAPSASTAASASASDPFAVQVQPDPAGPLSRKWEPIVFPAVPQSAREPEGEPVRSIGTRLTRQYAAFFDEAGRELPNAARGTGEPLPIGESVANILKAGRSGPYPSTWRGSLFEPEDAPAAVAGGSPAASAAGGDRPTVPLGGMPLRRMDAFILRPEDLPAARASSAGASSSTAGSSSAAPSSAASSAAGPSSSAASGSAAPRPALPLPAIPPSRRISRQNAVYLDKDGKALPAGETTTAAAQFAKPPTPGPSAPFDRSTFQGPKTLTGGEGVAPAPKRPFGTLFARRSQSKLAVYDARAAKGVTSEKAPAPAAAQPAPIAEEEQEEQEVAAAVTPDPKGKKRARSPEDEGQDFHAEDAHRGQRPRAVKVLVRTYTTECSLLRAKVTVFPIPPGLKCKDKVVLFPPGKGPLDEDSDEESDAEGEMEVEERAGKRSREEFESAGGSSASEPRAKRARVEDDQ
ncbi:hypothetical protein C8Q77DRAFT_1074578 [Trametes polyzona]|nr:hypothetical protein C8Q77DRAFT_1074578 [Trametes polyzona]